MVSSRPTPVVAARPAVLIIKLLGSLAVEVDGKVLALPSSQKARALLAYLLLAPGPVARIHLCNLLHGTSADPHGELRWCVSKIRGLLDRPESRCVESSRDAIAIRVDGCVVDAIEVERSIQSGVHQLASAKLRELSELYTGKFLESLRLDRSPKLNAWVASQRRRFQSYFDAIHEQWVSLLEPDTPEVFAVLDRWLALSPANRRPHEMIMGTLARCGRVREGREHLALAGRLFRPDSADYRALHEIWNLGSWSKPNVDHSTCAPAETASGSVSRAAERKVSLAVVPLTDLSADSLVADGLGTALSHDLVSAIAMHCSVEVISYETMMALDRVAIGEEGIGHVVNADYIVTGYIRPHGRRLLVALQVLERRTARVCWADAFDCHPTEVLQLPASMGSRLVAAVGQRTGLPPDQPQLLRSPNSLESWRAYHQGLKLMYLFTPDDMGRAQRHFELAVKQDPAFAGALAGLSFTHFQNAFLFKVADRSQEEDRALDWAMKAVRADDRDPLTHFALGRALWLRGELGDSVTALERSVTLSTNFAHGHYALGFVRSQAGNPDSAIFSADRSRTLSPYDPLTFAMQASRAMAHLRLGQYDRAATWGVRAIGQWNAHVHTWAIAAHCLVAAGRTEQARSIVGRIRKMQPGYGVHDYLSAMHYAEDAEDHFRRHAKLIGME